MSNPTTFFQVAATLLGTLLISGVLAEARVLHGGDPKNSLGRGRRLAIGVLLVVVVGGFVVGELLCLDVLVGQPPTRSEHLYVELALAACAAATCTLAFIAVAGEESWKAALSLSVVLGVGALAYWGAHGAENSVYSGLAHEGVLAQCPGAGKHSAFIGTVTSTPDTAVRATPGVGTSDKILRRYPTNCVLGFKGFCLGTPVNDALNTKPDGRWFELQGQPGVVASANIRNTPLQGASDPATTDPRPCHGGKTRLGGLRLRAGPSKYLNAVAADPTIVPYVGFALRFADPTGIQTWHRLAPDLNALDGIQTVVPRGDRKRRTLALATICLAAEAPSAQTSATAVRRLGRAHGVSAAVLDQGRSTACSLSAAS